VSALLESLLADREVLYYFHQAGCEACAAAAPELARFESKHPSLTVIKLDANGPYPGSLGIKLKATPTYALRHGEGIYTIEGALKATDLDRWIKKIGKGEG
jgi:thiol-disulfide isomerase/thioredoxin